jgi:hypothetical protein
MYIFTGIRKTQKKEVGGQQTTYFDTWLSVGYQTTAFTSEHLQKQLQASNVGLYTTVLPQRNG